MLSYSETDKTISISNRFLELVFEKVSNGSLIALIDKVTGHCLLHNKEAEKTLFRLAIRTFPDGMVHWLDSRDAGDFKWHQEKNGDHLHLSLKAASFSGRKLSATVHIELESDSPLSRWKMDVENLEEAAVYNVTYPVVAGLFKLGHPVQGESIIAGRQGEGYIFEYPFPLVDRLPLKMGIAPDNPRVGTGQWHGMYPGSQQMQFILYNCALAGLYLATYDTDCHFKSFDLGRMPAWKTYPYFSYGNPVKFSEEDMALEPPVLSVSHYPGESAGKTVEISYDTVLGIFHGDWHDGADVYKDWARKQWWCQRKLQEKDIPAWLRNGFGVFLFANYNGLKINQLDHPLGHIADFINNLSAEIGKPILAPIFNWEGQGAWTSPAGLFPPKEGESKFKGAMAVLKKTGSLGCVSIPGDEWYLQVPFKPASASFNCWDKFNAEARPWAIKHSNGELYVRRLFAGWAQIQLCPYLNEVKTFMIALYKQCLDMGISVIWNGGFPDGGDYACCYDPAHGHPLGFGPWWGEKYREILAELNRECKALNPDFVHVGEGICEIFIPYLDLYDHRAGMFEVFSHLEENFPMGGKLIPLFNYVYHEYIGSFSAPFPELNRPEVLYWARCLGKSLAQGALPMGACNYPRPQEINPVLFDFYKRITRSAAGECWKYIMFGEMMKPPVISVPMIEFSYLLGSVDGEMRDGYNRHVVRDAAVEHSAWRAPDGDLGYLFINVSENRLVFDVNLTFDNRQDEMYDVDVVTDGKRTRWLSQTVLPVKHTAVLEPLSIQLVEVRRGNIDTCGRESGS